MTTRRRSAVPDGEVLAEIPCVRFRRFCKRRNSEHDDGHVVVEHALRLPRIAQQLRLGSRQGCGAQDSGEPGQYFGWRTPLRFLGAEAEILRCNLLQRNVGLPNSAVPRRIQYYRPNLL